MYFHQRDRSLDIGTVIKRNRMDRNRDSEIGLVTKLQVYERISWEYTYSMGRAFGFTRQEQEKFISVRKVSTKDKLSKTENVICLTRQDKVRTCLLQRNQFDLQVWEENVYGKHSQHHDP
jgi:hypothetical protein